MTFARQPQKTREQRIEARQSPREAPSLRPLSRGSYGGEVRADPKRPPHRDTTLMEMARGRRCLLQAVQTCEGPSGTSTVTAHRNEGKGMSTKASDAYSCWSCGPCHEWYDRSGSPREQKRSAFMAGHLRQVLEWRRIASDASEPQRFRRAAQRALEWLNAMPIGEAP